MQAYQPQCYNDNTGTQHLSNLSDSGLIEYITNYFIERPGNLSADTRSAVGFVAKQPACYYIITKMHKLITSHLLIRETDG